MFIYIFNFILHIFIAFAISPGLLLLLLSFLFAMMLCRRRRLSLNSIFILPFFSSSFRLTRPRDMEVTIYLLHHFCGSALKTLSLTHRQPTHKHISSTHSAHRIQHTQWMQEPAANPMLGQMNKIFSVFARCSITLVRVSPLFHFAFIFGCVTVAVVVARWRLWFRDDGRRLLPPERVFPKEENEIAMGAQKPWRGRERGGGENHRMHTFSLIFLYV